MYKYASFQEDRCKVALGESHGFVEGELKALASWGRVYAPEASPPALSELCRLPACRRRGQEGQRALWERTWCAESRPDTCGSCSRAVSGRTPWALGRVTCPMLSAARGGCGPSTAQLPEAPARTAETHATGSLSGLTVLLQLQGRTYDNEDKR